MVMNAKCDEKQAVQCSSSNHILDAALRLQVNFFPKNNWLGRGNRYGKDTINRLNKDGNNAPSKPKQLAEYIAASVILHCTDGWTFFSNAMDHLMNGDIATSVFMAYYAQLRAVMSFLASEGIGIFNTKHLCFDDQGNCYSFVKPTHQAVGDTIKAWADCPQKSIRLLNLLNLEGKNFEEWINAALNRSNSAIPFAKAKELLENWSLDLNILSEDHHLRNEASYRPQGINSHSQFEGLKIEYLKLMVDAWRVSEPVGSNRFNLLDCHLLKNILKSTLRNLKGRTPQKKEYTTFVENAVANLGLPQDSYQVKFLSNSDVISSQIIFEEAQKEGKDKKGSLQALPVLSRAFLLLRLASAATEDLLSKSSIGKDNLLFWWKEYGGAIGLWIPGDEPEQMADLWADVKDSVDAIEDWYSQYPREVSVFKVKQEFPYDSWQVKQFNRVGLWGIGL